MKIDGVSIPITVESYIWLIERIYKLNIVKNRYINDDASPYDILGHILKSTIEEDIIYNRYMHTKVNHYNSKELLGSLDIAKMISENSIVNGKILGDLHYTKNEREYNIEILSMIHKAIDILTVNKGLFNDKQVYRKIEELSDNTIFVKYNNNINIDVLEQKYGTTRLCNIIKICKLIFNSELKRQERKSDNFIDDCTLISIRHLIEQALRTEIYSLLTKDANIKVFKDNLPATDTTLSQETDITILGNKLFIIEIKTGMLTEIKRRDWVNQTLGYMFTSADKYSKKNRETKGIILYLIGQKKDDKIEYMITDFNNMEELIKVGNGVTVLGLDMSKHDTSVIESQIKHLAKLIVAYNLKD